jgi:hypothetical protein
MMNLTPAASVSHKNPSLQAHFMLARAYLECSLMKVDNFFPLGHLQIAENYMPKFSTKLFKEGPLTTSNQLLSPYTVALRLR